MNSLASETCIEGTGAWTALQAETHSVTQQPTCSDDNQLPLLTYQALLVLLGGPAAELTHAVPVLQLGLQLLVGYRAQKAQLPVLLGVLGVEVPLPELLLREGQDEENEVAERKDSHTGER